MKKFIGNVNGKSFDNEKDFNAAAVEAIKANDDNLSISSYYRYEEDKTEPIEKLETPTNYVSKEDYILTDQTPSLLFGGKVLEYKISDDLKKKLEDASNKNEIRGRSVKVRDWLSDTIKSDTERVKDIEVEIERLQDELYEKTEGLKNFKARRKYYENILNIVGPGENVEKDIKESATKIDSLVSNFDDVRKDLFDFLRDIRFF